MATDTFKGDGAAWHIGNLEYSCRPDDFATLTPTERGKQPAHVTVACPLCGTIVKRDFTPYHYRWVGHYVSTALREHLAECQQVSRSSTWGDDLQRPGVLSSGDPVATAHIGKGDVPQTVIIRRDHERLLYEVVVI